MLAAEEIGIPAVGICLPSFVKQARMMAKFYGKPDLAIVEWPGTISNQSEDEIKEIVEKTVFAKVIDALTAGTAPGGPSPDEHAKTAGEEVFEGSLQQVNDYFYDKGWTDGLPIIPPTREAVEEMVSWTDLPPHEQIEVLPVAHRRATPWSIAVNAVMTGCLPQYLPVLIGAVRAMADPGYKIKDIVSTASIKPFFVLNGPVIKQLDVRYGMSVTALGKRSNSTMGRALGLIVRNIGGIKEGENWMGCFGWPGSPWIMAEDEDRTPWTPFHVDRGFDRETSAVTVGMMLASTYQLMTAGHTAEPHLNGLCQYIALLGGWSWMFSGRGTRTMTLFLSPPNANALAQNGFSKEGLKEYLAANAKMSVEDINMEWAYAEQRVEPVTVHSLAQEGKIPKEWDLGPKEKIPVLEGPDELDVFVCGSPDRNRAMLYRTSYGKSATRVIDLPRDWEQRLAKAQR